MVNAGRVLIIPQGAWTNLRPYEMLDLVSEGDRAYLARQASVGVRPSEDISMTYWQPFGSSASIATTDTPGLVMPDGVTITVDATGLIVATLKVSDLKDIKITNLSNEDVLKYDGTQSKWVNVALGTAATRNATSSITSGSTDLIESGTVYLLNQTLTTNQGTMSSLTTTDKTSLVNAVNEVNGGLSGKASSQSVTDLSTAVNNKHKVTSIAVDTSNWSSDTSSQSGTTLYKKTISLNHVYVDSPSIDIGAASGATLPTAAQQTAYDLLSYVTVDSAVPCLYLYGTDIPTDAYYINAEGVD